MKLMTGLLGLAMLCVSPAANAAANCMNTTEGDAWKSQYRDKYDKLMGYFTCEDETDPVACNVFVGRAAEGLYSVTDFKNADGSYMPANTIMDFVKTNSAWSKLGMANDQAALDNAADGAQNQLIIAVMSDDPHGHVAIVMPGDPMPSSSWGNLRVPNSASAFLGKVDKAYIFCRLSWAFKDPSRVELWWRLAQ